jgi:hypothetical protein
MQDCVRQISPQLDVQVCLRGMNCIPCVDQVSEGKRVLLHRGTEL